MDLTTAPLHNKNERILLINADDLGLSPHANAAIEELFALGAITSATLMMPAPYAAEAAARFAANRSTASASILRLPGRFARCRSRRLSGR